MPVNEQQRKKGQVGISAQGERCAYGDTIISAVVFSVKLTN
jgi:hypothetical protein